MLKRIPKSIFPSSFLLVLCVISWSLVSGLDRGFFYGVFAEPSYPFGAHGPNYYQEHNLWYFKISLLILTFIAVKSVNSRAGSVAGIALFCINLVFYWNMVSFKLISLQSEVCCQNKPWLQTAIYIDIFAAVVIIVILCMEVISMLREGGRLETIQ